MNYQYYDENMANSMGYSNMYMPMNQPMNPIMSQTMPQFSNINTYTDDLERLYPETYRVIYPMVCLACDNLRTPLTEQTIDMMTDNIYDRVEADGRINIDPPSQVNNDPPISENIQENRQGMPRRNRFLRDFIRVLLLRELLGRRRRFPMRPF